MKRLLVCLLLVGVVGCGTSPNLEPPVAQDDRPEPPSNTNADKAIADCTEAIRINPDYAEAYNNRGAAYQKLGDKDKAEADFAKAKELGVDP